MLHPIYQENIVSFLLIFSCVLTDFLFYFMRVKNVYKTFMVIMVPETFDKLLTSKVKSKREI